MSETSEVERIFSAMRESARLVGIDCAREKVLPVLHACQDGLSESVVIFHITVGDQVAELDFTVSVPQECPDPYSTALASGLIERTDHPVGSLFSDILERCPVSMYALDSEVNGGFKKTYAWFPPGDLQALAKVVDIPSMPRSAAENASMFESFGLSRVQMASIDYQRQDMNLYFGDLPAEAVEPDTVVAMAREMGLKEPSAAGLEFAKRSFSIYPSINWESSEIDRLCFAVITTDPDVCPTQTEPERTQFSTFTKNSPYVYEGDRALVYGLTLSRTAEYYKAASYYRVTDVQRRLLKVFDDLKD